MKICKQLKPHKLLYLAIIGVSIFGLSGASLASASHTNSNDYIMSAEPSTLQQYRGLSYLQHYSIYDLNDYYRVKSSNTNKIIKNHQIKLFKIERKQLKQNRVNLKVELHNLILTNEQNTSDFQDVKARLVSNSNQISSITETIQRMQSDKSLKFSPKQIYFEMDHKKSISKTLMLSDDFSDNVALIEAYLNDCPDHGYVSTTNLQICKDLLESHSHQVTIHLSDGLNIRQLNQIDNNDQEILAEAHQNAVALVD